MVEELGWVKCVGVGLLEGVGTVQSARWKEGDCWSEGVGVMSGVIVLIIDERVIMWPCD